MKRFYPVLLLTFLCLKTQAQTDSSSIHIRQMLELTGSLSSAKQMMVNMIGSQKKEHPEIPQEFWDKFQKSANIDDLANLLIPIYAKYFSDDEILQLIAFYQSPIGRKLSERTTQISQESYYAGQEWGRALAEKILKEMDEQKKQ